jgi:hypothetical protein
MSKLVKLLKLALKDADWAYVAELTREGAVDLPLEVKA